MTIEPATSRIPDSNAATDALKAFRCIADGDFGTAASVWVEGRRSTAAASSVESVAALNNIAVGHLLRNDVSLAIATLDQAVRLCGGHESPRGLRSTSTAFHVRLAAQNAVSFETASASREHQLQNLLKAHVRYHRRLATGAAASAAAADLQAELQRSVEAASMSGLLNATLPQVRKHYAAKAARLHQALQITQGDVSPEIVPYMTALLTPAMIDATSGRAHSRVL